jgi:hypothetical protein
MAETRRRSGKASSASAAARKLSAKKERSIRKAGCDRTTAYGYTALAALLLATGAVFRLEMGIPQQLLPVYLLEIIMGASIIIAFYKTMEP